MERNGLVTTAIARMRTRRLSFRTTLKASHPFGLKIFFPFVLSLLPKISLRQYLCLISDRSLVGFHTSSTPNTRNRNRVLRSYGMEILGEVVFSRKGRRWGERNLHERLNWTRQDSAWYSISRILRQPPPPFHTASQHIYGTLLHDISTTTNIILIYSEKAPLWHLLLSVRTRQVLQHHNLIAS